MRKTIFVLLTLGLLLSILSIAHLAQARVAIGSRSDEVKIIQEILKSDPEIYPEGYVTGYFGSLTEKAIKKLQKKCGLPETGILDENTEKCLYPIGYQVKVTSPNGGEVWDKSQIQTITWQVIAPSETTTPSLEGVKIKPFWSKISIDLFRRTGGSTIFVRHIATTNLFDQSYSWKIAPNIPNGKDYVIRISSGPGVGPIWYREKAGQEIPPPGEIWPVPPRPYYLIWDESDGTFEITGEAKPIPNLNEVIAILEKMLAELQRAINLLKGISQ
jgi:peptidoglycan hydrolase-like protein with peptidoglycan-binding domain